MVVSLTWEILKEYLQNAKEKIVFIMPAIHKEWIDVLKNSANLDKMLSVKKCYENKEC